MVRVSRRRLVFGATHDDPRIRLLHGVEQHVRILVLRRFRAVALRISVRRDMEGIAAQNPLDVVTDILREARVDLVQYVLPIEQRPHLANRLVADASDDSPASSSTVSVARRLSHQSCCV